jgi:hypothetical protein
MHYLVIIPALIVALSLSCYAEELGTKPLQLDKAEDWKEKSYRQYIGEKNYVS